MAQTTKSKIEEAETTVEWLDDLKVWPQDVDPKAKDTDEFYVLPEKPTQKELLSSLRSFRGDVKTVLESLVEIAEEQNRHIGELERRLEGHRHQNGPGTWTGKPEW